MATFSVWACFASAPLTYCGATDSAREAVGLGDRARKEGAIRVQFHRDGELIRTQSEMAGYVTGEAAPRGGGNGARRRAATASSDA